MSTNKEKRPFAVGFNGHANCCKCDPCWNSRDREFDKWSRKKAKEQRKAGELPGFPRNEDPNLPVFVNAFWRRAPRKKRLLRNLRLVG